MHWSLASGFGTQVATLLGMLIMAFTFAFAVRKKPTPVVITVLCAIALLLSLFLPSTGNGEFMIPFALLMTGWLASDLFKTNKKLQARIESLEKELGNK